MCFSPPIELLYVSKISVWHDHVDRCRTYSIANWKFQLIGDIRSYSVGPDLSAYWDHPLHSSPDYDLIGLEYGLTYGIFKRCPGDSNIQTSLGSTAQFNSILQLWYHPASSIYSSSGKERQKCRCYLNMGGLLNSIQLAPRPCFCDHWYILFGNQYITNIFLPFTAPNLRLPTYIISA